MNKAQKITILESKLIELEKRLSVSQSIFRLSITIAFFIFSAKVLSAIFS